jgi:hypothetical protein
MTIRVLIVCVLCACSPAWAQSVEFDRFFHDKTLRIDFFQTGAAKDTTISLDRMYEQGKWAGNPTGLIDSLNSGMCYVRVMDIKSDQCIYTRGFATLFGEYQTTGPARQGIPQTYHQSVLIPCPKRPFRLIIQGRDPNNALVPLFTMRIDPADVNIIRQKPDPRTRIKALKQNGPAHDKVDLVFVAEGYTAGQWEKFQTDAARFTEHIFGVEPFKTWHSRFNVSAVFRASAEEGADEPTKGSFKNTILSASYNALGTPRYLLMNDNRMMRDTAGVVPYDYLIVLVNTARYGGGGIYNDYMIFTADNRRSAATLMHEFGHSFANLADEYFGGVAYESFFPPGVEPHTPNITALLDPSQVKWQHLLSPGIPIPTPWGQEEMAAVEAKIGAAKIAHEARIAELRQAQASQTQIEACQRQHDDELKARRKEINQIRERYIEQYKGKVGVFEGAGYTPKGLYRSEVQIGMYRDQRYGPVSEEAIRHVIEFLSR